MDVGRLGDELNDRHVGNLHQYGHVNAVDLDWIIVSWMFIVVLYY